MSNEKTIEVLKPSQLVIIRKHVFLFIALLVWIMIPPKYLEMNIFNHFTTFHLLCIATLICLFHSLLPVLFINSTTYELTTERLIVIQGYAPKKTIPIELYRVHHLEVVAPLFLNIFGLSNIIIYTSDPAYPMITLLAIKEGQKKYDIIRDNVELMRETKKVYQMV